MKILFLVPYPLKESPSQRFRFEQYFSLLEQKGHQATVQSFLDSQNWQHFFKVGKTTAKVTALIKGFWKRFLILPSVQKFDFVFIHREATPIGPPIIEWIIAKVLRKKIIYDFDDAIWLTDRQKESLLFRLGKWRGKVKSICAWCYRASCGNDYLRAFASAFNATAVYNPTTVDTEQWHNPALFRKTPSYMVTLGWTGSHSTLKYLKEIEPVLQKIESEYTIRFIVIADRPPSLNLKAIQFIPWNAENEIRDLMQIDIGLMPLPDDEWSKGKCGFKIIQYLALNIPAIASPVGVNRKMIINGVTGFLCETHDQWYEALKTLIESKELRTALGTKGREYIHSNYSVSSNAANFLALFE